VVNNKSPLLVYLYTLLIIILFLVPVPNLKTPEFNLIQTDKLIHLIIYFVMFLIWVKSNILNDNNLKFKTLIVVFFISFSLEFLQGTSFINRYFELADLIANSFGIILSYGLFVLYPYKKSHA
jgi:hypothetical protein